MAAHSVERKRIHCNVRGAVHSTYSLVQHLLILLKAFLPNAK
jgi:hypothetical protein